MKFSILSLFLTFQFLMPVLCSASAEERQNQNIKRVDNGGSGMFRSVAVSEESLPGFVVYRPEDMFRASASEHKLPVLIWCNGGCSDTSIEYERMLTELASHGYVIIALGDMKFTHEERIVSHTSHDMLPKAIEWIKNESVRANSPYKGNVDIDRIAAAGHSCGGAQVLANARDKDLKTCLILNAGMGDMEMAGASRESLSNLRVPVLYMTGGPDDVAYDNAILDFERIKGVPVTHADMPEAGHAGTYKEPGGGDFGRMVKDWLDWNLKGKEINKRIFAQNDTSSYPGWTIRSKEYGNNVNEYIIPVGETRVYGVEAVPDCDGKKGVAIVSHGFNGTHHFARDYFETLNDIGYIVYSFDFPCGSVRSLSDSNTANMSIMDEKNTLKAIVSHYLDRQDIDPGRIVLIGESQGGLVSALAAGELQDSVSRLVLIYPALCIPDNWNSRYKTEAEIPDITELWDVPIGRRFFMELRDMDVYGLISRYQGPVQIVHGSKDAIVPLSYSEEAMKRYRNAHIGVIPGAGHGFNPKEREISNQFVKEFLTK